MSSPVVLITGTDQTAESYAATFDSNVLGVLSSMKHELRAMLPQGSGSIVNVSSAYGSAGAPKAGLNGPRVPGMICPVRVAAPGIPS